MIKINQITETLMFPYHKSLLEPPLPDSSLLFANAENPEILKGISATLVQPRHDKALPFTAAGHKVLADIPSGSTFDTAWILPGKDMQEAQYLLAQTAISARKNGIIIAAAPNDAGGKRLEGFFELLGLTPHSESKHKARVVFASVDNGFNRQQAEQWIERGKEQPILHSAVLSRPGLHSWQKIDEGSALLARHLPADLTGSVADFGCGWGYLSLEAVERSKKISRLTLIDIDARAVSLAERNVHHQHPTLPLQAIWADLTHPGKSLGPYNAILLNPPFHAGTHADPALGQAIITTAAKSLAPSGRLFLVANKHLPYEKNLRDLFSHIELLAEENGFKVLACR
jgi:16S rRNA (guanine1207-N2)-methyltransferase